MLRGAQIEELLNYIIAVPAERERECVCVCVRVITREHSRTHVRPQDKHTPQRTDTNRRTDVQTYNTATKEKRNNNSHVLHQRICGRNDLVEDRLLNFAVKESEGTLKKLVEAQTQRKNLRRK